MEGFFISGIQQVGVGTQDFRKSWNWFIEMFNADVKILEDDTVAERMLPYTGGHPQKRHACIAANLQGGGGFEIWQYSERTPVPAAFEVSVADIGIFAAKVKCRDVNAFHAELTAKWDKCTEVCSLPDGTACFYVKDLYGNWFQVVEQKDIFIEQHRLCGGILGALVGVTDMDRSIRFYKEVLGFDKIVYDTSGRFGDWTALPGGKCECRRVLMATSAPRKGAFSSLLPAGAVELVQTMGREPKRIYEGRYWGDPGFIQICFDITGMKALGEFCAEKGHPFTVDSCLGNIRFDMGDASGHFTYIEDPDGTLIEFVETHKIPIAKKLGWFLDMKKRNPEKQLPKLLFRVMGLVSREKIK